MTEEATITIDPTPEKRPVLPEGTYGGDGEAELRHFRTGTVKFGRSAGQPCIAARISVLTDEGYVTIFEDYLLEGQAKNRTLRTLAALGVDLANLPRNEDGTVSFDVSHLEGSKVIAEVTHRSWEKDGVPGEANGLRSVTLRR